VRAGLALVDAVAKIPSDTDAALSARIGIDTGVTVVGDLTGEGAVPRRTSDRIRNENVRYGPKADMHPF
jgi:class 3 adenylate cyclase